MKSIEDRTNVGAGDCVLVTGSIGPQFAPRLFAKKASAVTYAREILAHGKAHKVLPAFAPCLELRHSSDMRNMQVNP